MSERASGVHPLPLPPAEHAYLIAYTVGATTYLEAVTKATGMLRSDVHLIAVQHAERRDRCGTSGPFWEVALKVWESSDG